MTKNINYSFGAYFFIGMVRESDLESFHFLATLPLKGFVFGEFSNFCCNDATVETLPAPVERCAVLVDVIVEVGVVVDSTAFLLFVDIVRPTVGFVPALTTVVGLVVSGFGFAAPDVGSGFLSAVVSTAVLAKGLGDLLNDDLVPLEAIVDGFGVIVGALPVRIVEDVSFSTLGLKLENDEFGAVVVSDRVGATRAMGAVLTADGRM